MTRWLALVSNSSSIPRLKSAAFSFSRCTRFGLQLSKRGFTSVICITYRPCVGNGYALEVFRFGLTAPSIIWRLFILSENAKERLIGGWGGARSLFIVELVWGERQVPYSESYSLVATSHCGRPQGRICIGNLVTEATWYRK